MALFSFYCIKLHMQWPRSKKKDEEGDNCDDGLVKSYLGFPYIASSLSLTKLKCQFTDSRDCIRDKQKPNIPFVSMVARHQCYIIDCVQMFFFGFILFALLLLVLYLSKITF